MDEKRRFPVSLVTLGEPGQAPEPVPSAEEPQEGSEKPKRSPTGWRPYHNLPHRSGNPTCEGCGKRKPPDQFTRYLALEVSLDEEEAPSQLCDACATYGPPARDPLRQLTAKERRGLQIIAGQGNVRAAARAMGVGERELRRMLSGEERKVFRAAFQRLMIDAGLDPMSIIQPMVEGLRATRAAWNKRDDDWNHFPDHGARLKAAQMAAKLHDLNPPNETRKDMDGAGGSINFQIVTNLGDASSKPRPEGVYEVEVEGEVVDDGRET